MEKIRQVPTWPAPLSIAAIGLFSISSLLLVRFMYLFPLSPTFNWASASGSFLTLVSVAALAFFIYVTIVWSFSQALALFVISVLISTLAEILGLSSGMIFGSLYRYHSDIGPQIASCLPIVIPLGWFIFSCIPLILLRPWLEISRSSAAARREKAHQITAKDNAIDGRGGVDHRSDAIPLTLGRLDSHTTTLIKRVIFCSLLLTSFNLFLEPLFVYTRSWSWNQPGSYFGAPLTNLSGWFCVGFCIFSCFFFIQSRWFRHAPTKSSRLDYVLIGLFLVWVFVAVVMISEILNSLTPLWLTLMVLVPSLGFRLSTESTKSEQGIPILTAHETNVPG